MNMTQSYTPTFMEKLLGRNYKWWYLLYYEFKRSNSHFQTFIINSSVRAVEFLAIVYIWKINDSGAEIITYLAIGRVFSRLLNSYLDGLVSDLIATGKLTKYLLLPGNPLKIIVVGDFGFNFIRQFINATFTLLVAVLIFRSDILLNYKFLFLIPFLVIGLIIRTYFFELLGFISFWSKDSNNSNSLMNTLSMGSGLLSGEVLPLFVLFSGFYNPIFWTPFTYFLHHPMQIYLGKYDTNQIILVFLGGVAWCVILYFLAKLVFKLGLKRNESVGL